VTAKRSPLAIDADNRASLWALLIHTIEAYLAQVDRLPISPELDVVRIRKSAEAFDFMQPMPPEDALRSISAAMVAGQVHTQNPRYFGLFNPSTTTMSIAADALVAALNPQLAAWSHSPVAVEMERHLVRSFAKEFGLNPSDSDGVFTTGGAESNQTALLAALNHHWPATAVEAIGNNVPYKYGVLFRLCQPNVKQRR
jgi:glutamate/tyrosine decarboxylase-like PLP-dependent enzyme